MFVSVKNNLKRGKLVKLLAFIAGATQAAPNFAMVPAKDAGELSTAEPSFIAIDPSVTGEGGTVKVTATAAGIAASQAAQGEAAAAASKPAEPKPVFQIESGVAIPESKRGGPKADIYPFDSLQPGQSFFVASTEAKPNPAKSLASTVSSATRRYAEKTGEQETVVVKGKTITRDKMKQTRKFTIRAIETPSKGARIWRTA